MSPGVLAQKPRLALISFPSPRIVPDRSSPSRVRFAASRPGPLRADLERGAVHEGKRGGSVRLSGPSRYGVSILFSVLYLQGRFWVWVSGRFYPQIHSPYYLYLLTTCSLLLGRMGCFTEGSNRRMGCFTESRAEGNGVFHRSRLCRITPACGKRDLPAQALRWFRGVLRVQIGPPTP